VKRSPILVIAGVIGIVIISGVFITEFNKMAFHTSVSLGTNQTSNEPTLVNSDTRNFSKPIVEQIMSHSQIPRLLGLTDHILSLYDWSRDGRSIIAASPAVILHFNGTTLEKLYTLPITSHYAFRISPSGKYVLFSGERHNSDGSVSSNLYLYDIKGNTTNQITNNIRNDSDYRHTTYQFYGWVSDQNIIYSEENDFPLPKYFGSADTSLWLADYTGKKIKLMCHRIYSDAHNFTNSHESCFFGWDMDISSDGKKIAFDAFPAIGIYNIDTNQTARIGPNVPIFWDIFSPQWIPNSKMMEFSYSPGENPPRIGIVSSDSHFYKQISGEYGGSPIVSPDGKYILFTDMDGNIMRISFEK
jgi:Tol biopolymer transport system component